jgi:hypothetical protein
MSPQVRDLVLVGVTSEFKHVLVYELEGDLHKLRSLGKREMTSSVTLYCIHAELYWRARIAARVSCRANNISFMPQRRGVVSVPSFSVISLRDPCMYCILSSLTSPSSFSVARTHAPGDSTVLRAKYAVSASFQIMWCMKRRTGLDKLESESTLWEALHFIWTIIRHNHIHGISTSELDGAIAESESKHGVISHSGN